MGRSKACRRRNRFRSCVCKVRFFSKAGAERALAATAAKQLGDLRPLEVYACQHCKGWHVGTRMPNSSNERKKRKKAREKLQLIPKE